MDVSGVALNVLRLVVMASNEQHLRRFLPLSDRYIAREGDLIIFHNNSMIVNGVVSYRYTPREKFELNNLCLNGFHNIDIATHHTYVAMHMLLKYRLFFLPILSIGGTL